MLIDAFVVFFAFMSRLERSFAELSLAGLNLFRKKTLQTGRGGEKYRKCID